MIHSLAGELGLDVYVVSLARIGLDDTALGALMSELPERCIALMEDIDAAFHHGLTRDMDDEDDARPGEAGAHNREREKDRAAVSSPVSRVTLSGLLNALDGVGAQEGRILYATTNRYSKLDPALCRPGRMDLHVEFKLASQYQARELFKCFYMPTPAGGADEGSETKDDAEDDGDETDSAYGTGSTPPSPTSSANESDALTQTREEPKKLYFGDKHRADGPRPSRRKILALADRFADAIPEREFSMASLQGYLMSYKTRPVEAAEGAVAWIVKEKLEKAGKAKRQL